MQVRRNTVGPLGLYRSFGAGLVGGLVGSALMAALGYLTPTPGFRAPFYVAPFMKIGVSGMEAYIAGWVLNIVVGLILGAAYSAAANGISALQAHRPLRGLALGLVAGVATWLVYGLPTLSSSVGLGHPFMVGAVLLWALVYGVTLGVLYSAMALRMTGSAALRSQTVSA